MPAETMVNTAELRFVTRVNYESVVGQPPDIKMQRSMRCLQQRWVVIGTMRGVELTSENSEWRDVPLVEAE